MSSQWIKVVRGGHLQDEEKADECLQPHSL